MERFKDLLGLNQDEDEKLSLLSKHNEHIPELYFEAFPDETPTTTPRSESPRPDSITEFQVSNPPPAQKIVRRIYDRNGKLYATEDERGRLKLHEQDQPLWLIDTGCCIIPGWFDISSFTPIIRWCCTVCGCKQHGRYWVPLHRQ